MKRIEDIEKLSLEELEKEAAQVTVPEGLTRRIEANLLAADNTDDRRQRRHWHAAFATFAVAAAVATVLILHRPAPKDSFDDPLLAYRQVEETLQFIAQKINKVYE